MSSTYTLLLRSDAAHSRPAEREGLVGHLTRIPGVVETAPDRYAFGDEDEHGVMELDVYVRRNGARVEPADVGDDEADRCDELEVRIPRPWVMEQGPRVFALVFMLAEWARWEVFDPQIEDTLQKEAVLSGLVAMRQAQREQERKDAGLSEPMPVPPPMPDEEYLPTTATPPAPSKEKAKRRPWWKLGG